MTAPIKFELSPRGTLNSLKFAHEQPRDDCEPMLEIISIQD